MAITPNSEVHLLNVPLENDYKNQIYFENKTDQTNYFKSKVIHSYDNLTYQRKDNIIRIPTHIDNLYNCNYVMYQNTKYTNRWFYAFITKMDYVNDGTTHIHIETDVYQTWLFDTTLKASFVEREHVMDDSIGIHTVPEGLETGEYISNKHNKDDSLKDGHKFVLASTVAIDGHGDDGKGGTAVEIYGGMYGGIYTGTRYYTYDANTNVGGCMLGNIMQTIVDQSGPEAISSVFMAPKFLCTNKVSGDVISNNHIDLTDKHNYYDHIENKPFSTYGLDGYFPKNKKLFTFPYCYLNVDNGNGSSVIYHYEYFKNNEMKFHVEGVLTPGCSIRMVPLDYKGSEYADREGINLGKFPICSYATDIYTNWLTQNSVNIQNSYINAGLNMVNSVASGVDSIGTSVAKGESVSASAMTQMGSSIISSIGEIRSTMRQKKNAEMIPPQVGGNVNCGDVITAANNNTFHYYHMSIKQEFAKQLDNYFEMFGYQINQLKVPNVAGRPHWNYVKTCNVNIDGSIPNEDMEVLKNMYNNGVTLWKNGNNLGNYTLNNH